MLNRLFGKSKHPDDTWPFSSPKNEMTVTVKQVVEKALPILLVHHDNDEDDGGWQFLTGDDFNMADGMLVNLKAVTEIDPSIYELADLPPGWQATRQAVRSPWVRAKTSHCQASC